LVAAGSFRADLYYRLNVLPIRLPPLRERLVDLEALVDALAEDIARRSALPHKAVAPEVLELLARQPWPGNIRELRNVLEQATLMTDDALLTPGHFTQALGMVSPAPAGLDGSPPLPMASAPVALRTPVVAAAAPAPPDAPTLLRPLGDQVAQLERQAIGAALRATGGNRMAAARLLKMSRAALYDRLARYPELETGA
jgi:DNA-binding NtrC family response regulator